MEDIENLGLQFVDGVFKLTEGNQAILAPIGTCTRNGKYRPIAYAILSGESGWAIKQALLSVDKACDLLFPTQKHSVDGIFPTLVQAF